jgi:hypothetical protein
MEMRRRSISPGQSGNVIGRLVRADGITAKSGVDVLLTFQSQSGLPGRAVSRTDSQGAFRFTSIPVGAFNLEAIATDVAGIARMTASLTSNGQELDLGNVVLDEDDPRVVSVTPVNTGASTRLSSTCSSMNRQGRQRQRRALPRSSTVLLPRLCSFSAHRAGGHASSASRRCVARKPDDLRDRRHRRAANE